MTSPLTLSQRALALKTDSTLTLNTQGQLGVSLTPGDGLVLNTNGLSINADPQTLAFNNSGALEVNLDPDGPWSKTATGIDLRLDPTTLEVDNWELGVKLDPDEAIDSGPDGLCLNLDETLLLATNSTSGKTELGVHLNTSGPITADDQGIDLDVDPNTMQVNTGPSGGMLAVKLKSGGGLTADPDGISVTATVAPPSISATAPLTYASGTIALTTDTQTMQVNSNQLAVKLKTGGGLTADADGISVSVAPTPTISASPPLTYTNGQIGLSIGDQSLQVSSGQLQVKLKSQGGIQQSTQGLGVAVDQTLKIVSNTLEVNTDPSGPLTSGNNGLSLAAVTPLAVSSAGVTLNYQSPLTVTSNSLGLSIAAPLQAGAQGLTVNTMEPLSASAQGIQLHYGQGFQVVAGTLQLLTNPPIVVSSRGFTLLYTPAFTVSNNMLGLNVDGTDCVAISSAGLQIRKEAPLYVTSGSTPALALKYSSDFTITNGALALANSGGGGSSTPEVATYHCGDNLLESYDIFASLPNTNAAKVAAYCRLAAAGGVVSGTIQVTSYAGRWPKVGNSVTDGIKFAIVVSPPMDKDPRSNLSQWLGATVFPAGATTALFSPNPYGSLNTITTLPSIASDWYVPESNLVTYTKIHFKPTGSQQLQLASGELVVAAAKSPVQTTKYELIYLGFTLKQNSSGTNFFDPNASSDLSFLTPPIPFTYLGYYQ
ncbi:L5 fiber 1 [Fowl aviadenovirus A]|nr:long fiber protein [Fowl aviadenovirus A]APP94103.1 long fiber protein [Fowl aviadenovirus A]QGQ62303.1 L5 fiber 1 [Fowl aviadenovirus A]QNH85943.1 long fiber protein [Fowl aviadenovirus A]